MQERSLSFTRLRLNIVVAVCKNNRGIGIKNDLPWKIRGDVVFFKQVTSKTSKPGLKNAVLMGRKTWESIPEKNRPLRNRYNVVLSRTIERPATENLLFANSFGNALNDLLAKKDLDQVQVIGGSEVFQEALNHESCHRLYLTEVLKDFECDVFFPEFDTKEFRELRLPWLDSSVRTEGEVEYRIRCLQKIRPQYNMSSVVKDVRAYLVVAMDSRRGIGYKGILPWPTLSKDYIHYTSLVRGKEGHPNVAIIGRTSWESLSSEEKNLRHVLYIIISRTKNIEDYPECCCVVKDFQEAIFVASKLVEDEKAEWICFLGGHDIYKEAIECRLCERLYLTRVLAEFPCDVFFPAFEHLYELDSNTREGEDNKVILEENGVQFRFEEYRLKEGMNE